ncbi:MAG: hypothetical protein K8W52_20745 [Deltaproteobacteria bacterium]|nr:hypothetical protein [Deltaproteobacteria bacterium]
MLRSLALTAALGSAACVVRTAGPRQAERVAMRDGFTFLGDRWVNGGADHDALHVGGRAGRYTALMIVVEHSAVEMFDMVVTFGDGERWSPPTRLVFGENTASRVIDLPGGARAIQRVDFRYGNLPGGGKARVEIWGR